MPLAVDNISKTYTTRAGTLPVLDRVSLELNPGESVAITGPSGSGKSTLLHILGTLDRPTTGTVRFDDADPFALSDRDLAGFRNRRIGFVFQDHHLLPQCSVIENVLIPTLVDRTSDPAEVRAYAGELLTRVGLAHRLDHRPAELSGGERQRVAVARALVRKPALVLADEPTGNLDRATARAVGEMLIDLHRREQTMMVVVTHSLELAGLFSDRREMADGRLVAG